MSERLTPEQRAEARRRCSQFDPPQTQATNKAHAEWATTFILQALDDLEVLESQLHRLWLHVTPEGSPLPVDRFDAIWIGIGTIQAERDSLRAQLETDRDRFLDTYRAIATDGLGWVDPLAETSPDIASPAWRGLLSQKVAALRAQLGKSQRDLAAETKMRKEAEEAADFWADHVDREKVALRARCEQLESALSTISAKGFGESASPGGSEHGSAESKPKA